MAVKKKQIDPNQLSLFDVIKRIEERKKEDRTIAGSFSMEHRLNALLSKALKHCPLSRELVAGRMSELTGEEITKTTIDAWTASSKAKHRFPAKYLPAFIEATGDREILKVMAEMTGCYLVEGEDALLTELGRIEKTKEELAKKEKLVRQTLDDLGGKNRR
ncbi:MAG: hypothetical protein HS130_07790 [Deltaproteobacteria bacterium]|nr:hypothetical protein [Deltaproteobacteria bacterium]MCL4873088.1 hypothetical protein [bacterium]